MSVEVDGGMTSCVAVLSREVARESGEVVGLLMKLSNDISAFDSSVMEVCGRHAAQSTFVLSYP